jgi:putative tricarboxylic transport membrane protein
MKTKDFYSGLIMLLLSGAIVAQILRSPSTQDSPGPGPFFLPTICALVIAGLSLTLLIKSVREPDPASVSPQGRRMWNRLVWIVGWCFLYGITIKTAGYLLSTGIVTFALLAYFNRGRWVLNIIFSLITPISIYILFDTLLKVPLPKGWLGS